MNRTQKMLALAALAAAAPWVGAQAADHQVQMVNKDADGRVMQFEPAFLKIAPGDSVTFVNKDKGHNSESIPQLTPEGAETWKGKINQEVTVTLTQEGFYGYKCQPHVGLGMVGLIQVGEKPAGLDAVAAFKLPGKGKSRMAELVAAAGGGAASN